MISMGFVGNARNGIDRDVECWMLDEMRKDDGRRGKIIGGEQGRARSD